jgi:acetyl esterase/lipase
MKDLARRARNPLFALGLCCATASPGLAAREAAAAAKVIRDVEFATVAASPLRLDLYLPDSKAPHGLIVWVHGGAWRAGSRSAVDLAEMTSRGWAVASVDYRLSPVARFPAQVHDIKAAIRYLRARAGQHGYPASRFVIAGSSAGGHLAALVGVSNGHAELEGSVGSERQVSSNVQAIVSLYGASNLTSILAQSTPHGLSVRVPALELLLGGKPDAVPELARLASPVFHVAPSDPPLLMLHGDQDQQMPINQSHELEGAYTRLGLPVRLVVVHGSGHGGPAFTTQATLDLIDDFLRKHLPGAAEAPARTPGN